MSFSNMYDLEKACHVGLNLNEGRSASTLASMNKLNGRGF